jgi:hypothetical protein
MVSVDEMDTRKGVVSSLWVFFLLVFFAMFGLFVAVCATDVSNDSADAQQKQAVLGYWDSTGAAIVLVGFPLALALVYLARVQHMEFLRREE